MTELLRLRFRDVMWSVSVISLARLTLTTSLLFGLHSAQTNGVASCNSTFVIL